MGLSDYDAIERAVTATERGRWFLQEFARRNRRADTQAALDAIARLEDALIRDGRDQASGARVAPEIGEIERGLAEMAERIAETRSRISTAPFRSVEPAGADPLLMLARTTGRLATSLEATAGHIQGAVASLRQEGASPDLCNALGRHATEVATVATIQNLATQRIAALVATLQDLDGQVESLMALCDGAGTAADTALRVREREGPSLVS